MGDWLLLSERDTWAGVWHFWRLLSIILEEKGRTVYFFSCKVIKFYVINIRTRKQKSQVLVHSEVQWMSCKGGNETGQNQALVYNTYNSFPHLNGFGQGGLNTVALFLNLWLPYQFRLVNFWWFGQLKPLSSCCSIPRRILTWSILLVVSASEGSSSLHGWVLRLPLRLDLASYRYGLEIQYLPC